MPPGSEEAFLSALQVSELTRKQREHQASGINSAELTILLPSELLHNVLVPRGIMSEVAQRRLLSPRMALRGRSGSRIDVGAEGPARMLQVTLTGQMVGNAMAALLLQEQARERRFIKQSLRKPYNTGTSMATNSLSRILFQKNI